MSRPSRPGSTLAALTLAYTAFVVYGSLVPLDYRPLPLADAWEQFRDIGLFDVGAQGRADWIANGVLYVPLGFLLASLLARLGPGLAIAGTLLLCWPLALAVEFTQLAFPPRTVSLNDILAEWAGSALGALLAVFFPGHLRALLASLSASGARLSGHLLYAYGLAYLAFSLFPYDFLLSRGELADKLASDLWGWLAAPAFLHASAFVIVAKLIAEALAALPLGLLVAWKWRVGPSLGLALGASMGAAIELAQFFIVSGTSQGLSVTTRAVGMGAGVWLFLARPHAARVAGWLRRMSGLLIPLYLVGLAAVSGVFGGEWRAWDAAVAAWAEVRLLPFYYHYYTTEQAALLSLVAVCLLYAPVGVLGWAYWVPAGAAATVAAVLAAGVEGSKLFLSGLHPDPTNVLIAAFAAWAALRLARHIAQATSLGQRPPGTDASAYSSFVRSRRAGEGKTSGVPLALPAMAPRAWPALAAGLGLAAWGVGSYPLQPVLLGLGLALYGVLIWFRPHWMWVVIPAALALLDLAPVSGRFFVDEFDLLLIVSVAVGYARWPPARHAPRDPVFFSLFALLACVYLLGALRGLLPWPALGPDALASYHSPLNGLRLAKPVLWAALFYPLMVRAAAAGHDLPGLFCRGLVAGLAGVVLVVAWERFAFPGLFDFVDVYRVTGPFSAMHVGGAEIETYLTIAVPCLVLAVFRARTLAARVGLLLLFAAATYALAVTFARMGYAAFAAALVLTLFALQIGKGGRVRPHWRGVTVLAVAGLAIAVLWPVVQGPFFRARLADSAADLNVRTAHWRASLALRDPGAGTAFVGMGLGSFPALHYWRSFQPRAAAFALVREEGETRLRLGSGQPVYVEQWVGAKPHRDYSLSMLVRGEPGARLGVSLCEKWLLTSARCVFDTVEVKDKGGWQQVRVTISSAEVGSGPWWAKRPVKLSLYNPGAVAVEVDELILAGRDGRNLLLNGDFSAGLDRWFFSVDNDRPWHLWSLPLQLLFELGYVGLAAFALFTLAALVRAGSDVLAGDAQAGAFFAALVGFLLIGATASLVDSPRLLLLFLLAAGLAARLASPPRA